jgi:glycyl-tRNA synthetase beta chain
MVREFTELQGIMGGIYAREEGRPEEVWKAIYFHYLPLGVEPTAPPTRAQLGKAALTWAAVSLADKLDTIVGLFAAGEKPTGSRDPYGLRRAAHGVFKILIDLPGLTGIRAPLVDNLIKAATETLSAAGHWDLEQLTHLPDFMLERFEFVLESRGFDARNVRAITRGRPFADIRPSDELKKLQVLPEFTDTPEFQQLAIAYKRARNIAKNLSPDEGTPWRVDNLDRGALKATAAEALYDEIEKRRGVIERAVATGDGHREAFAEAARFKTAVDQFFNDVLVMDPDPDVRTSRLLLLRRLENLISKVANISEIVPEEARSG